MKPRTVIYKHKKPDDLDIWKIRSLKLGFLWGIDPIYFYPGLDLVIRTGDRESRSVSERLTDNAGGLAFMLNLVFTKHAKPDRLARPII